MTERNRQGGAAGRARQPARQPVDGGIAELVPDRDRPRAWSLLVDGAPQSHVDLDDPRHLDFPYQRRLGHVADLVAPSGTPIRAVHLGAGALTLARYIAATRPRSVQQAVDIDETLTQWVRRELPLERTWRIRVRNGDARAVLGRLPADWADLIIADVFAGARTPGHLTTVEFLADVRRVLRPDGWYAANLTDGARLDFLRGQAATAQAGFVHTLLAAAPAVLRGRRFGNALLLAADREPPAADLTRRMACDADPARITAGRDLADFTAGALPVTDATARDSPTPPAAVFR